MGGFRIFTLAGVPVRVTAWYFIILAYWMMGDIRGGLIWAAAVTISILVHEFGHAMVAKHYRLNPSVSLHGWGGLCHHERAATDGNEAFILAAGPGAGLILGGLVFVAKLAVDELLGPTFLHFDRFWGPFVDSMLYVNIGWSLVNLLPLWPLDGGQLFRLGLIRMLRPSVAERTTHIVGTVVGVIGCALGFMFFGRFIAIIAGILTWMNIQRINDPGASGAIRSQNRHAKGLLKDARAAYEARDWETAARLAYQAKAESGLDPGVIAALFEILGVSNAAMGRYEEAWPFLLKTADKPQVYLAKVECVLGLHKQDAAGELVGHKAFTDLPADVRRDLEALATARA